MCDRLSFVIWLTVLIFIGKHILKDKLPSVLAEHLSQLERGEEEVREGYNLGDYIHVKGKVKLYRDKKEIVASYHSILLHNACLLLYTIFVCHWHLPVHCVSLTFTNSLCVIDIDRFIVCHWHLLVHCMSLTFTDSLCVIDIYQFIVCPWHLLVQCVSLTFTSSLCVIDIYCFNVCHWHLLVIVCHCVSLAFTGSFVCHWHLPVHCVSLTFIGSWICDCTGFP